MPPPLTEQDVRRYESLFRSRDAFTLIAGALAVIWSILVLITGTFYGTLGYDGFVSLLYRDDSGIALYGGKWYYLGVVPVLVLALTPMHFYATTRVDQETVLLRGRGMAWTFGVLHGFLLLALLAIPLGWMSLVTPLLTNPDGVILHRGERLYPPYYSRMLLALAAAVIGATLYHRATLRYTYRSIQRLIGFTAFTAVIVFIAAIVLARYNRDAIAARTGVMLSGTVLVQAAVLHVIHLGRWPQVLDAYGRGYCLKCGYDLRGTIAAGRDGCPECGARAPKKKEMRRSGGGHATPPAPQHPSANDTGGGAASR